MVNSNGAHKILVAWAKREGIVPTKLAKAIDCSYTHAWHVLRDETYTIGWTTIGKLLHTYGVDGPAPEMARVMPLN